LDFGGNGYDTPKALTNSLNGFVSEKAKKSGIEVAGAVELSSRFRLLIGKVREKYNQKVVILIDEYDKPMVDHLDRLPIANANRDILRSFYQVLKAADEHLQFVFLTGVSKFSKVSVFSGLNNLNDITLDARYAAICGYTQEELETNFAEHLSRLMQAKQIDKATALSRIRSKYNGYSWDGVTSMYNPWSTLLLFDKNVFDDYWFASGTPTFLIKLLKNTDLSSVLEPVTISSSVLDSFDPENINMLPLLFQTGYLTVKSVQENMISGKLNYTLGIPNQEVHGALLSGLLAEYSGFSREQTDTLIHKMQEQLIEGDEEGFSKSMKRMFAHIPYRLHIDCEAYYHSLLLLWISLLGFEVQGELPTNAGRMDAVWKWQNFVVVAELKYLATEKPAENTIPRLLNDAMTQIKERRYYERFSDDKHKIILLAVAFAGKETGCRMEKWS
jgi:hypothetical protein